MQKREFSKFVLLITYWTAVFFTVVSAYLALSGIDIGSFGNIVLAIWGLVSVAVGFYFWKAKAENLIKLARELPKECIEDLDEIKAFVD